MMDGAQTAEILLETPDVVETASEDDSEEWSVKLAGTMFADGLNANAWGLTEKGAESIATSLEGTDLTAGHPPVKGYGFTRSIHDGPGKPIGEVASTDVQFFEGAMMADLGGGYSANYEATVTNPSYAQDFSQGLMIGGDYGVSIGITAEDTDAVCSVCGSVFAECKHYRGEDVDGDVAGPLYQAGEADHLAVVYIPAWEEADSEVEDQASYAGGQQPMLASTADEFFGQRLIAGSHQECDHSDCDHDHEQAFESRDPWEEGDLVQWQAIQDAYGMIAHNPESNPDVVMVDLHEMVDGELQYTGDTLTAGPDDLVQFDPDMASASDASNNSGELNLQLQL